MQLNTVVQSNSAQAEQMAAAAENLAFQADELERALSLITGNSEGDRGPPQTAALATTAGSANRALSKGSDDPPTPPPIHTAPRDSDFATF